MFSIIDPKVQQLPLPANCKSCGGATKDRYLDTGTQENDYGAILYCIDCITHIASLFGFITPEKGNEIKRLVEEQYLLNVALNDQNSKLRGAVNDLVSSGYRNDSISFIELDLVHLDSLVNSDPREREETVVDRESVDVEQSNDEGMVDIPSSGSQFKLFN